MNFFKSLFFIFLGCLLSQAAYTADNQFALETASKQRSAQANAQAELNAVAQQLTQEEAGIEKDVQLIAQDEASAQDIRAWIAANGQDKAGNKLATLATLPMPILNSIVEFHHGDPVKLKFIANNMEKLIPGVIQWNHFVFNRIKDAKTLVQSPNFKTVLFKDGGNLLCTGFADPSNTSFRNVADSFLVYKFPNNKLVFKVCPKKFKLLENLSPKQLEFIASLYDLYIMTQENFPFSPNMLNPVAHIQLDEEQQQLYYSLPREIQDILDQNYGDGEPHIMPEVMAVHGGLVI